MQEPGTCNGWRGLEGQAGTRKETLSPTKRSGMGRTLAGGREGLRLPMARGARAVAGSSVAFVNPGQGRSAEQTRQQKVEGEGAAGWKVEMDVPAFLVGAIAG